MPADKLSITPATALDQNQRYQVITVLAQGNALVKDTTPEVRSPLQEKLPELAQAAAQELQITPQLPASAYPYLLLSDAAPPLYDTWQQNDTTLLITATEALTHTSLIEAFSTATEPLQYVYWMYTLTDLWAALEPIPQWRSSLLLANNLGIDSEQSLRIEQFIEPGSPPHRPPELSELKGFLQSLLALPHRGTFAPLRQIRDIILTVTSAQTLDQLRNELAAIGESLLTTPDAITPARNPSITSPAEETSFIVENDTDKLNTDPVDNSSEHPLNASPETTSMPPVESNPAVETKPTVETDLPTDLPVTDLPVTDLPVDAASTDPIEKPLLETPLEDDPLENIALQTFSDEPSDSGESTMVLPMKLTALQDAGRTDVGRQREHNEDCFFISSSIQKQSDNQGDRTQAHCLYVLCDGMGGHAGGEVASQLAAQTLKTYFDEHWPHPLPGQAPSRLPTKTIVAEAVKLANTAIFGVNEKEGRAGHERMGTTLVVVLLQGTEIMVAHVGDSRLYQYTRRSGLKQVTTDHEVGQREIKRGVPHDIAYARPDAYQLTQALGPRGSEDLYPDVAYLHFSEDTLLLLCSDGLCDNNLVETHLDSHIAPLLKGQKDLDKGMDELIDLSNEVNGHDNISAIAIRLQVSPDLGLIRGNRTADAGQTLLQ